MSNRDIKAYYINCPNAVKRRKRSETQFQNQNMKVERVVCVNAKEFTPTKLHQMFKEGKLPACSFLTRIELSIYLSHLKCMERFLNRTNEAKKYMLVFEDDVKLQPNFGKKLQSIIDSIVSQDGKQFSAVYLQDSNFSFSDWKNDKTVRDEKNQIYRVQKPFLAGTACYLFTREFCKHLFKKAFPTVVPIDVFYQMENWNQKHQYVIYTETKKKRLCSRLACADIPSASNSSRSNLIKFLNDPINCVTDDVTLLEKFRLLTLAKYNQLFDIIKLIRLNAFYENRIVAWNYMFL